MNETSAHESAYAEAVAAEGMQTWSDGIWLHAGVPTAAYGWKIHVSSTQRQALALLHTILPILHDAGVPFKLAASPTLLGEINEGGLGATQVGKFMTLYPPDGSAFRRLHRELAEATRTFFGPAVLTDLRIGPCLHARFGQFSPKMSFDRLGNAVAVDSHPDAGYKEPPFSADYLAACPVPADAPSGLGHDTVERFGFKRIGAPAVSGRGSRFLALDLRRQQDAAVVFVKHGRRHAQSDTSGRHAWHRLIWQFRLGRLAAGKFPTPRPIALMRASPRDLFLVQEHIPGSSLQQKVRHSYAEASEPGRRQLGMLLMGLVSAVRQMHRSGIIHRDITPSNVLVADDGKVWLIDLEMAVGAGDRHRRFERGTVGFMSPRQARGDEPTKADDWFAVARTCAFALSGLDPRRLECNTALDSWPAAFSRISGAPLGLAQALGQLARAAEAGDGAAIERAVHGLLEALEGRSVAESGSIRGAIDATPSAFTADAIAWLQRGGPRAPGGWLPLSGDLREDVATGDVPASRTRLYRSLSRGVSGSLYVLGRAAKLGHRVDRAHAAALVDWLLRREPTDDDQMSGLLFGEAGVALAIAGAVDANIVPPGRWLERYLREVFSGTPDWPDLSHGAAGQGLAALRLSSRGFPVGDHAAVCASHLCCAQRPDGAWSWPAGVPGAEGDIDTGFAHGIAGIVHFLSLYAAWSGERQARSAATRGARFLVDTATHEPDGRIHWPKVIGRSDRWTAWCNGAPGIAKGLIGYMRSVGEIDVEREITGALQQIPGDRSNIGLCHGQAGLADVLLDAGALLGGSYRERALQVARHLEARALRDRHGVYWISERPQLPTADFMIGSAGILDLLLRCTAGADSVVLL